MSRNKKSLRHTNISGFTLVELIVVVLITGILSASIAPRFFGVTSYEDRKAADELRTAFRHTQQLAMNRGGNVQLILTASNFTVQLTDGTALQSPAGIKPYQINFPPNVAISPAVTITYDRLGRPSAGATITLGSQTVTVEQETGYAR